MRLMTAALAGLLALTACAPSSVLMEPVETVLSGGHSHGLRLPDGICSLQ